jgi:hypothetical protein
MAAKAFASVVPSTEYVSAIRERLHTAKGKSYNFMHGLVLQVLELVKVSISKDLQKQGKNSF